MQRSISKLQSEFHAVCAECESFITTDREADSSLLVQSQQVEAEANRLRETHVFY